ncbi:MAG: hypothetical protein ACJ76H_04275 [Bacteriovoracaceae bacterium]
MHVDRCLQEIAVSIIQSTELAHDTWTAVSVTSDGTSLAGFFYTVTGKAHAFTGYDLNMELFSKLKSAMSNWQTCLVQIKASDFKVHWEFDKGTKFVWPSHQDATMAERLRPKFHGDECWVSPLGHDVILSMQENSPELVDDIDEISLHCMITNSFLRAMRLGFTDREDLMSFAIMSFEFAPNFDTHPAVRAAMKKVAGIPGAKWDSLYTAVPESAWMEIDSENFYDGKAWFSELPKEREMEVA